MADLDETVPEQPLLPTPKIPDANSKTAKRLRLLLGSSFFLFGLMNNVLYVIILSAALDLVPPSTPKGIIAFCNIAPALVAKVGWPYLLKGKIRYTKRLLSCCALSVSGMLIVAAFEMLPARLLGIAFASFASGLGELTFLQLSTTYHPKSVSGHCVGYFASGTGAAGLVGAGLWWEVRGLGVRLGVGLSAILPFTIPLTYLFLLPPPGDYSDVVGSEAEWANTASEYSAIPDDEDESDGLTAVGMSAAVMPLPGLSLADKWRLVRPLLPKYMLPLFCVYTFEYTINQGVSPTLVYPVPSPDEHPILGTIIKSIRDYYPLWQLMYQAFVFLSRSSISLGLPALPAALLPAPAVIQAFILSFLATEASTGFLSGGKPESTTQGFVLPILMLLIAVEGICGGLAYVNVFYRVGQEGAGSPDRGDLHSQELARQEQEFRIGSIGFADSLGILLASLIAMPTESDMRLFPVKPTNKAECGITSALKLASHVSVACGATSQYGNSLYSLSTQDVSQRNGSAFEIAAEDLPETGFRGGASRPLGRPSRKDLYRSRDTLAPINDTLRAVEASQARRSPLLAMRNVSNPNFSNPIYSILEAADLRSHWTTSQIRQLSVTHLEWYEAGNGRDSFLLFEVLPTFTRGKPTWVRLERRPRTSASKQTLRSKMPIGNSSMSDIAILSKGKYDLLGPEDDSFILKETVRQMLPLSFVLDVLDAVPENALSNSQLYASIIMNAVHQFCAPTDISRKDAASTQSNNPYRILRHTANKKACDDLAQEIELQQGWELL